MNIFQYVESSNSCKYSTKYDVDNSIKNANKTTLYRVLIKSRYINYYVRRNTGMSKIIDGNNVRVFIFLPTKISDILSFINHIPSTFKVPGIQSTFSSYPYIIKSSSLNGLPCFDEVDKYFYEQQFYRNIDHFYVSTIENRFAIIGQYDSSKDPTEFSIRNTAENLVYFADNLIKEFIQLKLNINKLEPYNPNWREQSSIPPFVEKAFLYTGILAIKVAARSIGADFDANFDFDTNVNFDNLDISSMGDFDFDFDTHDLYDVYTNSDYFDGIDGSSSISFMGAPNDGTYIKTGQTVSIRTDSGKIYKDIKVFLHNGTKWIDFKNHWFDISSSNYFSFLGNGYKVI